MRKAKQAFGRVLNRKAVVPLELTPLQGSTDRRAVYFPPLFPQEERGERGG